jgi:hypothetical protein
MAQNETRDQSMPSRSSNREQSEGSRESVRNSGSQGGGVTNRSRDREIREQQNLPERGTSQSESVSDSEFESEFESESESESER